MPKLAQKLYVPYQQAIQPHKNIMRESAPEVAIHIAMQLPKNQHQTAVAGPPEVIGNAKVAGTLPRTPRIEIAYDTVDHLVNSRCSS